MIGHAAPAQQTLVEPDAGSTTLGRDLRNASKIEIQCWAINMLNVPSAALFPNTSEPKLCWPMTLYPPSINPSPTSFRNIYFQKNDLFHPNMCLYHAFPCPLRTLTPKFLTPSIFRAPRHDRHVPRHRKRHLGVWHGRWNVGQAPLPSNGVGDWNLATATYTKPPLPVTTNSN